MRHGTLTVRLGHRQRLLNHPSTLIRLSNPLPVPSAPNPPLHTRSLTRSTSNPNTTLPQGLLKPTHPQPSRSNPSPPLPPFIPYPTVIAQARDHMARFRNCVVLTRVGGFYELYCEQAEIYGPQLGIKVAAKATQHAGKVPMAGFPWMQLDRYLRVLVEDLGRAVALVEEVREGNEVRERRVSRVVTGGTLVDERFLVGGRNCWCVSLWGAGEGEGREGRDERGEVDDGRAVGDGCAGPGKKERLAADKLRLANTPIGLAWVDLSTGEFFTQNTPLSELSSLITRIGPKEILLTEGMGQTLKDLLLDILGPEQLLVSWQPQEHAGQFIEEWGPMLDSPMPEATRNALTLEETAAGSVLLNCVKGRLIDMETKLRPPIKRQDTDNMVIDKDTMRGLEILETIRDSRTKGSLLHAVGRTVTNSGARLLRDRVTRPSTILSVINERLDLVEELLAEQDLRKELRTLLTQTFDSQRLIQKFALARADADDLVSLSRTIQLTEKISNILKELQERPALAALCARFSLDEPSVLSTRIANAIDEDGLIAMHEQEQDETADVINAAQEVLGQGDLEDIKALGTVVRAKTKAAPQTDKDEDTWIMRRSASSELSNLHEALDALLEQKHDLCQELKARSQLRGLSLQWQPSMGYICHLKGKGAKSIQAITAAFPEATVVRGLKTTSSFHIPAWTELGKQIDETKKNIRQQEQVVFCELRDEVVRTLLKLRRNAAVLDELDVACSSATLAQEQNAVRPVVDSSTALEIIGGRHPTVTLGLEERGRAFVANDCFLNSQSSTSSHHGGERVHLITGPNMAGKSTFLRQNALLALLAQTGLFVPAAHARIGIVDALFARIGSADNLFSDQSTFMTEMLETAHILTHATNRSLVIMDEVGRGTTPEDGEAVAMGALRHLVEVNGCRALFATHFHGVVDAVDGRGWGSEKQDGEKANASCVGMYCTDIKELDGKNGEQGGFVFVHKVRRGVNRNSHALRIASMAGLPRRAIEAAREVLMLKKKA